jgi:hypothetical protein
MPIDLVQSALLANRAKNSANKINPGTAAMKIPPLPFTVTDWSDVAPTVHPGETGRSYLAIHR